MEVGGWGQTGSVALSETQAMGAKDQYQLVRKRLRRLSRDVVVFGAQGEIQ